MKRTGLILLLNIFSINFIFSQENITKREDIQYLFKELNDVRENPSKYAKLWNFPELDTIKARKPLKLSYALCLEAKQVAIRIVNENKGLNNKILRHTHKYGRLESLHASKDGSYNNAIHSLIEDFGLPIPKKGHRNHLLSMAPNLKTDYSFLTSSEVGIYSILGEDGYRYVVVITNSNIEQFVIHGLNKYEVNN